MALNVIANLKVEVVNSEVSFCIRPDTESTHAQCVLCRRHDIASTQPKLPSVLIVEKT